MCLFNATRFCYSLIFLTHKSSCFWMQWMYRSHSNRFHKICTRICRCWFQFIIHLRLKRPPRSLCSMFLMDSKLNENPLLSFVTCVSGERSEFHLLHVLRSSSPSFRYISMDYTDSFSFSRSLFAFKLCDIRISTYTLQTLELKPEMV